MPFAGGTFMKVGTPLIEKAIQSDNWVRRIPRSCN
jgi:hypothetical protein